MKTLAQVEFSCPMTREQAEAICAQGPEAVIFVLLALAEQVAVRQGDAPSVSTPSGMAPAYHKPGVRPRRKRPGGLPGHQGWRRATPTPTRREEHPALTHCPACGTPVAAPTERRFRLIEDVVETTPEVVEHSIPRQWCASCRQLVEPSVPDALRGATLGHRVAALTAWWHYGLGLTLARIRQVLDHQLQLPVSAGGLVALWRRVAAILHAWYAHIGEEVKTSGVLHADETGWRVAGRTRWLWRFTTKRATDYLIHQSRGSPALSRFFTTVFDGVLVTDFWAAYNAVTCRARQACLPHLFRELAKVDERNTSAPWRAFAKSLKRLLRDALRLRRRREVWSAKTSAARRRRLTQRLAQLVASENDDPDVRRLCKRLRRYRQALFTFVDEPDVPADNNHAEREIRPAVLMRKTSYCNRSWQGQTPRLS